MINLSPCNELGHSHRAQGYEPATHHTEAALLSVLTTAPSSLFLTFLCNGAQCGNKASEEVIANRVSERRAHQKNKHMFELGPVRISKRISQSSKGQWGALWWMATKLRFIKPLINDVPCALVSQNGMLSNTDHLGRLTRQICFHLPPQVLFFLSLSLISLDVMTSMGFWVASAALQPHT